MYVTGLMFVRMCVCPPLRLLITSGVIYDWLNNLYGFYMVAVVGIICGVALTSILVVKTE